MRPFSQVTILQVKTIALFPRTLPYALYNSSTMVSSYKVSAGIAEHLTLATCPQHVNDC